RAPGSYPYHTLNLTVPTTLRRRIVCWRACWAPRPLWGKNPAVPVRFLLQFFFHTPPPKLAHLSLHLGFDFPERAARLLVLFVHGPRVSALFVNRTRNRFITISMVVLSRCAPCDLRRNIAIDFATESG